MTLVKTSLTSLTSKNLNRLGGELGTKVAWITVRNTEGVKKAGLLRVLNNP
jgi:hypothetical protein